MRRHLLDARPRRVRLQYPRLKSIDRLILPQQARQLDITKDVSAARMREKEWRQTTFPMQLHQRTPTNLYCSRPLSYHCGQAFDCSRLKHRMTTQFEEVVPDAYGFEAENTLPDLGKLHFQRITRRNVFPSATPVCVRCG